MSSSFINVTSALPLGPQIFTEVLQAAPDEMLVEDYVEIVEAARELDLMLSLRSQQPLTLFQGLQSLRDAFGDSQKVRDALFQFARGLGEVEVEDLDWALDQIKMRGRVEDGRLRFAVKGDLFALAQSVLGASKEKGSNGGVDDVQAAAGDFESGGIRIVYPFEKLWLPSLEWRDAVRLIDMGRDIGLQPLAQQTDRKSIRPVAEQVFLLPESSLIQRLISLLLIISAKDPTQHLVPSEALYFGLVNIAAQKEGNPHFKSLALSILENLQPPVELAAVYYERLRSFLKREDLGGSVFRVLMRRYREDLVAQFGSPSEKKFASEEYRPYILTPLEIATDEEYPLESRVSALEAAIILLHGWNLLPDGEALLEEAIRRILTQKDGATLVQKAIQASRSAVKVEFPKPSDVVAILRGELEKGDLGPNRRRALENLVEYYTRRAAPPPQEPPHLEGTPYPFFDRGVLILNPQRLMPASHDPGLLQPPAHESTFLGPRVFRRPPLPPPWWKRGLRSVARFLREL